MAADTTIEWADKTWNPMVGCDRVSEGCTRCYAMGVARVREFNPNPKIASAFAGTTSNDDGVDWTGKVNLLPGRLSEPIGWRSPKKVFVNSMSDLFHKAVPDSYIIDVFAVMALTPQHTYQVLTKRPGRMRSILRQPTFWYRVGRQARHMGYAWDGSANHLADGRNIYDTRVWEQLDHLPNVWLGTSVEDQHWANVRIPVLLDTPAAVRWISAEPLLGPIRLSAAWVNMPADYRPVEPADLLGIALQSRLDWVVTGGESGPGARPMHPQWPIDLRDQCAAAQVPFLHKQNGAWIPAPSNYGPDVPERARAGTGLVFSHKGDIDGQIMLHVGKRSAGRLLDGREYNEYPAVAR